MTTDITTVINMYGYRSVLRWETSRGCTLDGRLITSAYYQWCLRFYPLWEEK